MNARKIRVILRKEWAEVFRHRVVLFTVIFLPLLMTALPLGTFYASSDWAGELPPEALACPAGLAGSECTVYFLLVQFLLMFMIMPLAIPSIFAAYSVVGEKTTHSLEPLLATPISTRDLLLGKGLAAVLPGLLATWAGFGLFVFGLWLKPELRFVAAMALEPTWLLAVFLLGALMAVLSVLVSLMVSSRVNDPRAAEQLSMVVILPLLALVFAQIGGWITIDRSLVLWASLALLGLDFVLLWLAEQVFEREAILTRWK